MGLCTEQEWATWAGNEYARIRIIEGGQLATDNLRYPVPAGLRDAWALACQPLRKATARVLQLLAEEHGFEVQATRWRQVCEGCPGDLDLAWETTWSKLRTYDPILHPALHIRPTK